jgi:hypothetical protein
MSAARLGSPVSSSTPQHLRPFALLDPTSRASFRAVRSYALVLVSLSLLAACSGTSVGGGIPGETGDETGRASSPGDTGGTKSPGSSEGENGSGDYDALFGPPAKSERTSGVLEGLWAGTMPAGDVRLVFADRTVTVAVRCSNDETRGVEVAARLEPGSLQLLESKNVGEAWDRCSLTIKPVEITACATRYESGCYLLDGTKLSFEGIALFSSGGHYPTTEFTKLSD